MIKRVLLLIPTNIHSPTGNFIRKRKNCFECKNGFFWLWRESIAINLFVIAAFRSRIKSLLSYWIIFMITYSKCSLCNPRIGIWWKRKRIQRRQFCWIGFLRWWNLLGWTTIVYASSTIDIYKMFFKEKLIK